LSTSPVALQLNDLYTAIMLCEFGVFVTVLLVVRECSLGIEADFTIFHFL